MPKSFRVALLAFVLAGISAPAHAGPPQPSAGAVLAKVQHYYASASHLTAQFRQVVTNVTFGASSTSTGTLWVARPLRFRLDYLAKRTTPPTVAKTFAFDGKDLWMVDHENLQLIRNRVQNSSVPVAVAFLAGAATLDADFHVAFDTSGHYGGKDATVLALTPKHPSAAYKQLFFVVDPADGHVGESIVLDSSGNTSDFSFDNPDLKKAVDPNWFRVDPKALPTYKLIVVP